MECLEIKTLGAPVLRERAKKVTKVTKTIRDLAQHMFDTMYEEEGIGLAAPQVGVPKQLIVVDTQKEGDKPLALVNPRVVEAGERRVGFEEGCLSVPGVKAMVYRPEAVVVQALNLRGDPVRIDAHGMLARVLQHEIDHLNGVLFIDHLAPAAREQVLEDYRKLAPRIAAEA